MRVQHAAFLMLVAVFCGAGPSYGQSLAEVARMEADRRKLVKDGGKVYTNRDLPNVPQSLMPAVDTSPRQASADKGVEGKKELPKALDQAGWSKRMKDLRDGLDRDQTYVEALQSRVNALTADVANRDDPAQRAKLGLDRQKASTELDRLKKQIGDDKRAIADLEEEARRAGVPPGWLR